MTPQERDEQIARYRRGAHILLEALTHLSDADLDGAAGDGGWSARSVAHHVADAELTGAARLRRLIAEDSPRLPPYTQRSTPAGSTTSATSPPRSH
jgi:hypothetical protein